MEKISTKAVELLKEKVQHGDYRTLATALNIERSAAKMRFYRGDVEAFNILKKIVENRESIISTEIQKKRKAARAEKMKNIKNAKK